MEEYLKNLPNSEDLLNKGFSKVLIVRKEVIHIKHILTEVFVRKSLDITKYLNFLNVSLFDYMSYMTNRMRKVHHFSRSYKQDLNSVVNHRYNNFFPSIEFLNGLNVLIALDFDGVVTENSFRGLYLSCLKTSKTQIFSANPTVSEEWFIKNNLPLPDAINSRKGKLSKIKALIEASKKYDMIFYVDNEIEYLNFAFIFGIKTYQYIDKKIKYYSLL